MAETATDLTASDYDALVAAVQETPRGRWFLAEYARRNRQADTQMLLAAIARLEAAMRSRAPLPADAPQSRGRLTDGFLMDGFLSDLSARIAQARQEAAAIHPALAAGAAAEGNDILAAAQSTAEAATAAILAAAEHVQETAWALREQEPAAQGCDFLDMQATDIYTACATQDLAHQCLRRAVAALGEIETEIGARLALARGEAAPAAPAAAALPDATAATGAAAPDATADATATTAGATSAVTQPIVPDAPCTQPEQPLSALETLGPEATIALFT